MSKVGFLSSVLQTAALMGRDGHAVLMLIGVPAVGPRFEAQQTHDVRPNNDARDRSPRGDGSPARVAKI